MANGDALELSQVGILRLLVIAAGVVKTVKLTDVYVAPHLACNIVSFEKLVQKGLGLCTMTARDLSRAEAKAVAFDVKKTTNVLFDVMATALRARGLPT